MVERRRRRKQKKTRKRKECCCVCCCITFVGFLFVGCQVFVALAGCAVEFSLAIVVNIYYFCIFIFCVYIRCAREEYTVVHLFLTFPLLSCIHVVLVITCILVFFLHVLRLVCCVYCVVLFVLLWSGISLFIIPLNFSTVRRMIEKSLSACVHDDI